MKVPRVRHDARASSEGIDRMRKNYLLRVLQDEVDAGVDPAYWWDEARIPLDSIDKRVSDLLDLTGRKAGASTPTPPEPGLSPCHRASKWLRVRANPPIRAGLSSGRAVLLREPALSRSFKARRP